MSVLPELDQWGNIDIKGMLAEVKRTATGKYDGADFERNCSPDEINAEGCRAFVERHGFQSDWNRNALAEWCYERDVPTTLKNLEIAMMDLKQNGQWDYASQQVNAAVESVPLEHDPAALRKLPLDQLKKLIQAEKQQSASPQAEVSIVEEETDFIDSGTSDDATVTQAAAPVVETESDLKKLPLAELRRMATADRIARRTSRPTLVIQI